MSELGKRAEVARTAARAAGAAAMQFHDRPTTDRKADSSPVTDADRAANAVILEHIRGSFPEDAILSEESRDSLERLDARRVWIVDPLDGTKEFLARNGEFSVMIGLVEDGAVVAGAVFVPATGTLYSAVRGGGAWVEEGGSTRRLQCSEGRRPPRLVGSRSHADPLTERMGLALGIVDVVPCGSVGVKCARIVEGERDLYVHPVPYLKEWDTCAPEIVVREAGGWVSDCRGEPLRYNKPDPRQPHGILVCAPGLAGPVLATIGPLYETSLADATG